MNNITFLYFFCFLCLVYAIDYGTNLNCNDHCNDCITKNLPKDILFAPKDCTISKNSTSFIISVRKGYNGCGYAQNIDDVYKKCTNECQTCQKIDSKCEAITDHPSSTIECKPLQCAQRGDNCTFNLCCDGLECLSETHTCIDPKTDCTPCGQNIEPNKPCCDSSGIKADGIWKCATGGCKDWRDCPSDSCCISGSCMKKEKDKDTGSNASC